MLKYAYTLPELLRVKEYIEMMDAIQEADHKDEEIRMKQEQNK